MGRGCTAAVLCLLLTGCGYQLVRYELPSAAGPCVHVDDLDPGAAHVQVALWASSVLRTELAPHVCKSGEPGAHLTGKVQWVQQDQSLQTVDDAGGVHVGGVWAAAATIELTRDGEVIWGPHGVEVTREFLSTGSAVTEMDAMDTNLRLLSESLAQALVKLLYEKR